MSHVVIALAVVSLWALAMCRAASRAESLAGETPAALPRRAPYALACGVGIAAIALRPTAEAVPIGVACVALVAAAPADARTGLIFDAVTAPTAAALIALSISLGRLDLAVAGVVCVAGFFALVVTLSGGRWMGLGDVKAIFTLAAAFGPVESTLAIFVACLSGIAAYAARGRSRARSLAFGPHLAVGACATLAAGPYVEHVWMRL